MNIYDVIEIEHAIDRIAEFNNGEIPEEMLKELVEAQTRSIEQIGKLCRYIRHLETFTDACKSEIDRIGNLKQRATNRIESIKQYLTPYVKEHGKFDADTFQLSIRKSTRVDVDDNFTEKNKELCQHKIVITPDKDLIKKLLEKGEIIDGARLLERDNLQIK